jgi:hypothetical protein
MVIVLSLRVFIYLFLQHKLIYSFISVNFLIIFIFADTFIFSILILFFLSLFALLYFVFIDKAVRNNYPIIYQCLLLIFFLVLALSSLILLNFLFNFYYSLFFKVYYYLKDFLVKIFSSGKDNASSSASQTSGSGSGKDPNKNPNNNNNSNNDFKIPNKKDPKREASSQPRAPKDLIDFNKEAGQLNANLRGYTKNLEDLKKKHNINYSLDSTGTLSIDVPVTMSDSQAADLSRRVGVIDRLYNTQLDKFNSVTRSALAKTEELNKTSGVYPCTRIFLESHIIYNGYVKDTFNSLFRD